MSFEEIKIGDSVLDGKVIEKITGKTSNSIEVTRTARTKEGINCKQWFTQSDFMKKFKFVS